jgi:hypothetical protein
LFISFLQKSAWGLLGPARGLLGPAWGLLSPRLGSFGPRLGSFESPPGVVCLPVVCVNWTQIPHHGVCSVSRCMRSCVCVCSVIGVFSRPNRGRLPPNWGRLGRIGVFWAIHPSFWTNVPRGVFQHTPPLQVWKCLRTFQFTVVQCLFFLLL